jgi:uncharacterized membrane protein
MTRFLYAILLGLVGAGIVHIAILVLLPRMSERDAWSILSENTGFYTPTRISGGKDAAPLIGAIDPMFEAVACRFDLTEGIAHVQAEGTVPFWSVSIYDQGAQNIFSFADRTATDRRLDLAVLSTPQMLEIRKETPPEFLHSIFAEAGVDEGIVVVRALVPDESWRPRIDRFLNAIRCQAR